jgi:hypothetical protein
LIHSYRETKHPSPVIVKSFTIQRAVRVTPIPLLRVLTPLAFSLYYWVCLITVVHLAHSRILFLL